ncbi:DUF899 family protein [Roseiarcus sp.]|uniref:DUF899 family protein n=1 Tax=Roseiarcus sp. TaxID=1969460 RepID=UPI003C74DA1B
MAAHSFEPQIAARDRPGRSQVQAGRLTGYRLTVEQTGASDCKHCSCVRGAIAGGLVRLAARDASFAAVSRAPIAKIEAFKRRLKRILDRRRRARAS